MCLKVAKSHVRTPIHEVECFKLLSYKGGGRWMTPYQDALVVQGNGWFMPKEPAKRKVREYRTCETIYGGYIHAFTDSSKGSGWWSDQVKGVFDSLPDRPKLDHLYRFRCVAREVVAVGSTYDADVVCRALYIPAFDLTGAHRHAILDFTQ